MEFFMADLAFEKFRRRILVTSVVSKTPQMPKVGIFLP